MLRALYGHSFLHIRSSAWIGFPSALRAYVLTCLSRKSMTVCQLGV
jgi:hypothetical protein